MRISFDLDGVLFVSPEKYETEAPLAFPRSIFFPDRLRKGTIDLIHTLQEEGFEVWIYTSSFRAKVYIRALFRRYGVHFDGIINGYRHRDEVQRRRSGILPSKIPTFYQISLHVDDEDMVIANSKIYGFRAMKISEPDADWADKVLKEARRIRKLEEQS